MVALPIKACLIRWLSHLPIKFRLLSLKIQFLKSVPMWLAKQRKSALSIISSSQWDTLNLTTYPSHLLHPRIPARLKLAL
mmetsp:Transcript_2044/g.4678  ORF Transcript_2044/g.4678 Transcript_2044/m.4678 type:complete len:80 (+) Transcript_2044:1360-1599(+)